MNKTIEDERNEFKEVLNSKFEKEVISFLNTHGGNIFIGVKDSGETIGIKKDLDKIQLVIKDRIKNNISPSTIGLFDIKVVERDGFEIVQIIVAAGNEKPYYLRDKGMILEGCFIRIGSSTETMPSHKISTLFSNRTRNNIRNIVSPNQNLSFGQIKIYYEEKGYTITDNFYKHIGILMDDDRFNYLGYLLSDSNCISIKVATYSGVTAEDLLENEDFGNCSLVKATYNVLNKLNLVNKTFARITPQDRQEQRMINPVALREAVLNAIVHNAWEKEIAPKFEIFSDHFAISSAGGLPNNISNEEFLKGFSAPRNPGIMKVFYDMDLVEQLGTGIVRILKYYDKSVFEVYPNFIRINFPIDKSLNAIDHQELINTKPKSINQREMEIVNIIGSNPYATQKEMAEIFNVNIRTIKRDFSRLIKKGMIERHESENDGKWIIK